MGEIVPVILCGGVGSRLWPPSRKSLPKQFAPLIGTKSLFEEAVTRVDRDEFTAPIVVASSDHRFLAEKQMRIAVVLALFCWSQRVKTPPQQCRRGASFDKT